MDVNDKEYPAQYTWESEAQHWFLQQLEGGSNAAPESGAGNDAPEEDNQPGVDAGEIARLVQAGNSIDGAVLPVLQDVDSMGQYASADERKIHALIQWLKENGATFSGLEIKIVNGLRGVYAHRHHQAGEVVMHIPRPLMVTGEVARHSEIGKQIQRDPRANILPPYAYMAAFIMHTRRYGGFWKPYFDILPVKFPGMPQFYDAEHLRLIEGTHIHRQVYGYKKDAQREYEIVKKYIGEMTLSEYAITRMAVTTRVYRIYTDGYDTLGMVPLADMLNHTGDSPTHWTGQATHGFTIMAVADMQAGGEILESYGARSNGRWLMSHGLCMEKNPNNIVELEFPEIRKNHPFFRTCERLGWRRRKVRYFQPIEYYNNYEDTRPLFAYLRLATLGDLPGTRRKLKEFCAEKYYDIKKFPPVSRNGELAAMRALLASCERAAAKFPTSLEEDEERLKDPDLVWTKRFAIMAAVSEKRMLKYYRELAERGIEILTSSPFELARGVLQECRDGRPYRLYFRDLRAHLHEFSDLWHVARLPERGAAKKKRTERKEEVGYFYEA